MPHVATSPAELMSTISAAAHLDGERLVIDDDKAFRDADLPGVRDLASDSQHDSERLLGNQVPQTVALAHQAIEMSSEESPLDAALRRVLRVMKV